MSDEARLSQRFLAGDHGKCRKRVEMGDGPWAEPGFQLRRVQSWRDTRRTFVLVQRSVADFTLDAGNSGPAGGQRVPVRVQSLTQRGHSAHPCDDDAAVGHRIRLSKSRVC